MTPTARPSIRASAVTISGANRSRRNVTDPSSANVSMIGRDVVGTPGTLGNHCAQTCLVTAVAGCRRTLEVAQQPLRHRDRFRLVGDDDVDDPVGRLHRDRADFVGVNVAEPAACDHRRSAHADRRVLSGDDQIGTPGDDRVARKAAALDDRDPRHHPRQLPPTA